ncbi:acylphosphatase [Solitalea sp. MAHUQ-68]|uniref:acylphosphatase n=1 Tax=Solitalea agri TaxID=2953739 RepID=A0A9X2JC41_9SPHI|nr:acylphosphatase [Solitalea agri]MCO4293137.1 acylphosphatase [Solitalea agri]
MKNLRITVKGKVQGVYYRASAKEVAEQLGLYGFVENQKDGSVYIEAEGLNEQLYQLVEWCKQGPSKAVVEKVDILEGELKDFKTFEVRKKTIFGF